MTTEVSTLVYKINFKFIIHNFNNPKVWKSSWTVYDYNGVKVKLSVDSINVRQNNLCLMLTGTTSDGDTEYNFIWLPLSKDHYNETVFNNMTFNALIELIRRLERQSIYKSQAYKSAKRFDADLREAREQIAYDFLDENGVTNDAIRDAYVRDVLHQFDATEQQNMVVQKLQYKLATKNYLMACVLYDKQDKYEEIASIAGEKDPEELLRELFDVINTLDIEDMASDTSDALEEI